MIISVDTETNGLDPFKGHRPFAITTCDEKCNTEYIAVGDDDLVPIDLILLNSKNTIVMFNAKFDILMLKTIGMEVKGAVHDPMIMAHVYNPDETNKQLKHLAEKYLQEEPADEKILKQYIRKHKIKDYSQIPRDILEPYARTDPRLTMGLFNFYRTRGVLEDPTYISEIKLLHALIRMQTRGVLIDIGYCKEQTKICDARLKCIGDFIRTEYGDININGNKQLSKFLFDEEGLTCESYSSAGNPVLDKYNLGRYDHPIIPKIIELRELAKIKETYLDGLQDKADENRVIHCDFYQVGTKTGRFSCRNPNLQNITKKGCISIRKAFIVRPDYTNYYFDYSQIELRIFAHYAKEQVMIDELLKADGDLHAVTARLVFGEDYTEEHRNMAKRLNFLIIYGGGAKKFAETLNKDYPGKDFTYNQAKMFIGKYYMSYPAVRQFTWKVSRTILNRGHIHDVFGRKYTCSKSETYKATNYLIQGCAAGVLKNSMVGIDKLLIDKKSNLTLCIHDELIIEIHKDEEDLAPKIKDIMEDKDTFRVPILVNVSKTSTNWEEKT